jgi:hypothetical protein
MKLFPAETVLAVSIRGSDVLVTSSTIPTVNPALSSFAKIAKISAGVVFLEPRP